jgi:hypothetical protein
MEITELEQLLPSMIGREKDENGVILGDFGELTIDKEDDNLWSAGYVSSEDFIQLYIINDVKPIAKGKTIQEALDKLYKKLIKHNLI